MQTLLVLGTVFTIGILGLPSNNIPVYAGDDYDTDDDDINWKKFKNSDTYKDAGKDTKKCFKNAHDKGDKLAGYEVEGCEEDADYGKDGDDGKDDGDGKYGKNNDDDDGKDDGDGKYGGSGEDSDGGSGEDSDGGGGEDSDGGGGEDSN